MIKDLRSPVEVGGAIKVVEVLDRVLGQINDPLCLQWMRHDAGSAMQDGSIQPCAYL